MAGPLPPPPLRRRVSCREDEPTYEFVGAATRDGVLAALPGDFDWSGKRVLDFGCGAGRSLRHFAREAARSEFLCCDIDAASIDWVKANLDPPFRPFLNEREPPLPIESGSVDLVIAVSVFTHLSESWARWLAELHRVLVPGGLLFATYLGPGVWPNSAAAQAGCDYERVGMHVEQPWGDFRDDHGPAVWHSPWWLRERWGRAFELLLLEEHGFAPLPTGEHQGQGATLWRRRAGEIGAEELARPGDDPREAAAAELSAMLARRESAAQVRRHEELLGAAYAERDRLAAELAAVRGSRVMRGTEPARRAWYRLRERLGR